MIRNKEFIKSIIAQAIVVAAGITVLGVTKISPILLLLIVEGLLMGIHSWYTYARYREIGRLTSYVSTFEYGKESLALEDNEEGELSILKSTLYKLCMKLLHQKELLSQDKVFLADAISDISHQLKTPLTSITVMADLLDQKDLDERKRKEFIRNIVISLDRMNWLIQALLKIAKLDAGSVTLKKEEVSMQSLVEAASKEFLVSMDINDQNFIIEGDPAVTLCCDKAWTVEAISNLIKNGMEHTPAGGAIKVSYGDNNIYTFVSIEDTGVGIAKEDLPHIFERFYRGKNSSINSVGIGLPLAKTIIMQQKGTIDVSSEEGTGTRFFLKFYR